MSDLYWLTDEETGRLSAFFPKSHGKPRVDDRRVSSGIAFVDRDGLRRRDAPEVHGPHKMSYSRWKRWSGKEVFARMTAGLAAGHGERRTVMLPLVGCFANHCRQRIRACIPAGRSGRPQSDTPLVTLLRNALPGNGQAPRHAAKPDRDHVRLAQGPEACGNPL